MYIIHCTLYIIHCTLYIVHYMLYIIHYTLYIVHCTLNIVHRHYTLYFIHYALYIVHCILYIVLGMYNVQRSSDNIMIRTHACAYLYDNVYAAIVIVEWSLYHYHVIWPMWCYLYSLIASCYSDYYIIIMCVCVWTLHSQSRYFQALHEVC